MSYIKPAQFFQMYSGAGIAEIQEWIIDDLKLSLHEVEWISWRPIQHGGSGEMRVETTIITTQGEEHKTHTSSMGTIAYHGQEEAKEQSI
jgi:hypothetical protein